MCPFPIVLSLNITKKSLALSSLCSHIRCLFTMIRTSWSLPFPKLNSPNSHSLFSHARYSSSLITFMALCWTFSSTPMSLLHRGAQNWTQHSRYVSPALRGAEHSPPSTSWQCASQEAAGRLCCKGPLLAHDQFGVYPQVLLFRTAFPTVGSQCMPGVVPPQGKDLTFCFIELHEILLNPLLQPV